jgi:hypothetical protein
LVPPPPKAVLPVFDWPNMPLPVLVLPEPEPKPGDAGTKLELVASNGQRRISCRGRSSTVTRSPGIASIQREDELTGIGIGVVVGTEATTTAAKRGLGVVGRPEAEASTPKRHYGRVWRARVRVFKLRRK